VENGALIHIADDPQAFAERCLDLIENQAGRARMTEAAWEMVSSRFSWDAAVKEFERLLT
jgi:glycosyltransferase involved in cell wall biosynthesis